MGQIELLHSSMELGPVELSDQDILENFFEGNPERFLLRNVGKSRVREIVVELDGEGKDHVQLAIEEDGEAGIWASPGESIMAFTGVLEQDQDVAFWARGAYRPEDLEGRFPFEFLVRTISG